ncbi:MAG TPA: serine hydrolase, partial [Mucilaginibacter sp.]
HMENNKLTEVPANTTYNLNLIEPAGDISMTLPDYIKFLQLNLNGLIGKDNIIKATTYDFLHYGIKNYAIGWANTIKDGQKQSDHAGSAGTFFCYALFDGIKNKAYVIIVNSGTAKAQNGAFSVLKLLREEY